MILRIGIVIPTYNNPKTIRDVVESVLAHTLQPVYVFDDGSDIPVETLVKPHPRVKICRVNQRSGKGATIARAIRHLVSDGLTHMLTLDGDGQHLARECKKLIEMAKIDPWSLIIGHREMEKTADVPQISTFGRKFSNFWVKYQTNIPISDSQSGMRLYPLFPLQLMEFWTTQFDFEIEVLIRLIWKGVSVREVDIAVYYPPPGTRVSHFNKLWDNVRISILNTILVCVSLLRSRLSAKEAAISLGIGTFIGATPAFGFHTFLVGLAAFVFRLNAIPMFVGSQISIPPLAPFVIIGSIKVGHHVLGIEDKIPAWIFGSIILGLVLATLGGSITYFVFKAKLKSQTKQGWNGKSRGGRFGNSFLKFTMKFLGLKAAYACLIFIIPYFYLFAPKARRAANEYWKIIAPNQSWGQRQRNIMKQLYTFAQILMDRVYFNYHPSYFKSRSLGFGKINDVKSGVILLSSHIGAWDLGAALVEKKNIDRSLYVVKYMADGFTFDQLKNSNDPTTKKIVASNSEQNPILRIRDLLNNNDLVGLMADRPVSARMELAPIFGKLALFDTSPFYIAKLCQASIFATYGFKEPNNVYSFMAEKVPAPNNFQNLSKPLVIQQWLNSYIRLFEEKIKENPFQWSNFYSFWSAVPAATALKDSGQEHNYLVEELHIQSTMAADQGSDS